MNKKRMKTVSISVVIIVITLIAIFSTITSNNDKATKHPISNNMNIAIVNEDKGYYKDNQLFQLGRQYSNQLTDTRNKKYEVVPRSIAENGLKQNKYQLVLFIPTNFSKTIMEINNPNPEQLKINYKIKAKDQEQHKIVQAEANRLLKQLNQKLVDIYALGMMNSLYVAQKDVANIYQRQGKLVNKYGTDLNEPLKNINETIPNYFETADSLMQEKQELSKNFADYQKEQDENLTDTIKKSNEQLVAATTSLEEQLKQTQMDKENLVSQLMEMNETELASTTKDMLQGLEISNQELQQQIMSASKEKNNEYLTVFDDYANYYQDKLQKVQKQFKEKQEQLSEAMQKLQDDQNDNTEPVLTLEDFLSESNPKLLEEIKQSNKDVSKLEQVLNTLPVFEDNNNLFINFAPQTREEISQNIQIINQNIKELQNEEIKVDYKANEQLVEEVEQLNKEVAEMNKFKEQEFSQNVKIDLAGMTENDIMYLKLQKGVNIIDIAKNNPDVKIEKLDDQTYKLAFKEEIKELKLQLKYQAKLLNEDGILVRVEYTRPEINEKITINGMKPYQRTTNRQGETNSKQEEITHQKMLIGFDIPINSKEILAKLTSIGKTEAKLAKYETLIKESYKQAAESSTNKITDLKENKVEQLLKLKLSNADLEMLMSYMDKDYQEYQKAIIQLQQNQTKVEELKQSYLSKLPQMEEMAAEVNKQIAEQLDKITAIQESITKDEKQNKAKQEQISETLESAKTEQLELDNSHELMEETNDIMANASQTAGLTEDYNEEFKTLDNNKKDAIKFSNDLTGKASDLQQQFANELAKSGDFTKSFIQVLNAGYKDGVPNEEMMKFIANPLKGKANISIKDQAKVYPIAMLVIIIAIVSLFIAYSVNQFSYKIKAKYFSEYQNKISQHLVNISSLTGIAIVVGLIITSTTKQMFDVINQGLWYAVICLALLLLSYINYILLNYLRLSGFAVSILSLIIFIVNDTQPLKGIMAKINGLELIDKLISYALTAQSQIFIAVLWLAVALISCVLIMIFVPEREKNYA